MVRKIWKLGGVILLLASFNTSAGSESATDGLISDFKLTECHKRNCIVVESKSAYVGTHSYKLYAFEEALIKIYDVKTKKETQLRSGDGYYDMYLNKIFLRSINGKADKEAIYDLSEERLFRFNLGLKG